MNHPIHRKIRTLSDAHVAGKLSRRSFVMRLLQLGLTTAAVASIAAEFRPAYAAAKNLKGQVRFLVGPWSEGEVDHHKHIAAAFNALHPEVTFDFRLYQWDT